MSMGCRVIVGGYRVGKWGTDACYLLRTVDKFLNKLTKGLKPQ